MHATSEPRPGWALSRRLFLAASGTGLAGAALAATPLVPPQPSPPVKLPSMKAKTERQGGDVPAPLPPEQRVGFAVVGLGELAVRELLPAFGACKRARLAALVSGSRDKAQALARQYGVPERAVYDYKGMDALRDLREVQVVYIVLPNGLHAEYTLRAAQLGKHVLCEKPMANSSTEAQAMIDACHRAGRKLMVAYRVQYEPHHRLVQRMLRGKELGEVRLLDMINTQNQGAPGQWRHDRRLAGGGALPDIGIYCLNTARFLLGEEPEEVSAMIFSDRRDPRFREVEDRVLFSLRFPSGVLVSCASAYSAHESRRYRVHCEAGWIDMDPAFSYRGLRLFTARAEGQEERRQELLLEERNQFALEMDHMAECVQSDRAPQTPGEEGLKDQRLMEAIYEAARNGRVVRLPRG